MVSRLPLMAVMFLASRAMLSWAASLAADGTDDRSGKLRAPCWIKAPTCWPGPCAATWCGTADHAVRGQPGLGASRNGSAGGPLAGPGSARAS